MDMFILQDTLDALRYNRYLQIGLMGLCLVGGLALGWLFYQNRVTRHTQQAHKAFMELVDQLEKSLASSGEESSLESVSHGFDTAYQQYNKTPYAPFMLAYKATTLLYDNKRDAAIDALTTALARIPKESPLFTLYATRLALMKMDAQEEGVRTQGLQELRALTSDMANQYRDWGLYYLGAYYWKLGDKKQAREIWAPLTSGSLQDSSWAPLINELVSEEGKEPDEQSKEVVQNKEAQKEVVQKQEEKKSATAPKKDTSSKQ